MVTKAILEYHQLQKSQTYVLNLVKLNNYLFKNYLSH